MITRQKLEKLKAVPILNTESESLVDICNVVVEKSASIFERIGLFMEQIKNPYVFKVGETPVKVLFSAETPLQENLLNLIEQA